MLLLSYNPLAIRVALVVLAILLMLGFLLYRLHSRRTRKSPIQEEESRPPTDAVPADRALFHDSMRNGPTALRDMGRIALILLAFCVAAGLMIVVLPQGSIEGLARNFRFRNPQAVPLEKISLLYLGDETKGSDFHIQGVIRNITTEPIEKLDATLRLYAPDGTLLETVVTRMDVEQIAPDATSSFHLTYPDYKRQFGSYSVDFKLRQGDPVPHKDMRRAG